MQETLKHKLHDYIRQNNPEILLTLQVEKSVTKYISDKLNSLNDFVGELEKENKPDYIIEEICLNELTKDLRPSKFNYISNILEEEFEFAHQQLSKLKLLQYEAMNMIAHCEQIFESFNFSEENEDDKDLRYAVTGIISEYLDGNL